MGESPFLKCAGADLESAAGGGTAEPAGGPREGRKCAAKPRRRTTHENGDRRDAVYGSQPLLRLPGHLAVRTALAALRFGAPDVTKLGTAIIGKFWSQFRDEADMRPARH